MSPITSKLSKKGFTLVEVMVTTVVFGLIMGTTMSFLISTSNFAAYNEGKLLVNRDIRKFTSELSDQATYSNDFIIYESFTDRTIVTEGGSGDFLVLAFADESDPDLYSKVIGFYRAATNNAEGPVMRFTTEFATPQHSSALDSLLPAVDTIGTHEEIIELSKGLSNGQLFFNFYDRSITVQGEILHHGSNLKRATNTYNFTVSPRG
jgi:prepilin-type N-terminal cleavage/methylation domain-containing protein